MSPHLWTPPPAAQPAPSVGGGMVPYRLATPAGGACTTIFLPAGDTKALESLRSKLEPADIRVTQGTCPAN